MGYSTPAAPQAFTFGTRQLQGSLVGFSGGSKRSGATHRFLKRRAGLVEDMNSDPRWLEVDLVFNDKNPAKDFNDFESYVNDGPTQLLNHPIAGKWTAFCEGPQYQVTFGQAVNEIRVKVRFIESELDAQVKADVPDVATAAQSVTSEQTAYQKAVATYVGALSKASTAVASAKEAIIGLTDRIEELTDPVTTLVTGCLSLPGIAGSVLGAIQSMQVLNEILDQQMSDFVDASNDLFSGDVAPAGAADAVTNLLVVVDNTARVLEDLMLSVGTPAGSVDAVGGVEEALAACYTLHAAVMAAKPLTIIVIVPRMTDLMSFCQKRYPGNAIARAADIQSLNHIINPAVILAGTRLVVPVD